MKKAYSTETAAAKIGVGFRTLSRWLAQELIRPTVAIPLAGGRTLWRWTEADIAKGRKVKASQKRGPKPRRAKRQ